MFSSILKNAPALYNAGVVAVNSKVVRLAPWLRLLFTSLRQQSVGFTMKKCRETVIASMVECNFRIKSLRQKNFPRKVFF
jgi:hypothetical protein